MHPEYCPEQPRYEMLSFVLGELEFTAYAVLETLQDWPGFWHDAKRAMEMMDEAIDDRDPVEKALGAHRIQIWETSNFQQELKRFFDCQSEVFWQYLGPSLQTHYFAYETHRPRSLTLTAWRKEDQPPQPLGGPYV